MDNLLTVHFHSMHGDYSRYSMWKWLDGYWGEEAHFSREDDFGLVGQVTSPSNRFIDSSIFWSKRKTGRGKHMTTVSDAS